jgi:hypothetical protein
LVVAAAERRLPQKNPGPWATGAVGPAGPWRTAGPTSWISSTALRKGCRNPFGPYANSFARSPSTHQGLHPFATPAAKRLPFHAQRPVLSENHALADFEQGDWLAELEVLQLANVLQHTAITRGGYDERSFELMFAIADGLEADHGWSIEQSGTWLERMRLWQDEF